MNSTLPEGGHLLVAVGRVDIRKMDKTLFRLFAAAFGGLVLIGVFATIGLGRAMRARLAAFERLAAAVIAGDIN